MKKILIAFLLVASVCIASDYLAFSSYQDAALFSLMMDKKTGLKTDLPEQIDGQWYVKVDSSALPDSAKEKIIAFDDALKTTTQTLRPCSVEIAKPVAAEVLK